EAKAIKKLYKYHKRMLAMMVNVTRFTLDKSLGDLGGTQFPDVYCLWLKFSVEALCLKSKSVPHRGVASLFERNKRLGATWKALPQEHKRVFHLQIFYTLS
ncbi:hypothetical protein DFH28DRAFT_837143, partial [Melampsora americana]